MNYRNGEECIYSSYKDMKDMTLEDAIYILSETVNEFHKAKSYENQINLPRPRLIRAYELVLEASEKYCMNKSKITMDFSIYKGKRLDNNEIVVGNVLQLDDDKIRIATSCLVDYDNPNILTVCAYEVDKDTLKKVEWVTRCSYYNNN